MVDFGLATTNHGPTQTRKLISTFHHTQELVPYDAAFRVTNLSEKERELFFLLPLVSLDDSISLSPFLSGQVGLLEEGESKTRSFFAVCARAVRVKKRTIFCHFEGT